MTTKLSRERSKYAEADALSRIVIFGDTQNISDPNSGAPRAAETAMAQWVLDNHVARNIGLCLHVGDVANLKSMTNSYTYAYQDFGRLFGVVPFVLVDGNHDSDTARDLANFNAVGSYVGYGMGDLVPLMTGRYQAGHVENSYLLTTLAGRPALVIGLEFSPRDAVMAWAKTVIEANPVVLTILLTHGFMYRDGTVYTNPPTAGQDWNPISYNWTPAEGQNSGDDIVAELIEPYPQVKLIVSGHAFAGHSHRVGTRANGTRWYGIQQDYQANDAGVTDPRGYMYELTLDFANDAIRGRAFSPYLGIEWPETRESSTDARSNNVYFTDAGIR